MSIRNVKTITKSELAGYIVTPATYVFVIIFLALSGFFTFMIGDFFKADDATLRGFFTWHPWLYLILVPAVGMHMWSDERRLGTDELLFTMPVTVLECVIGKFLAAWLTIGVALFLTFPLVITVCYLGSPDWGEIICGYIGSFLMAGGYLAVASFTSSITKSQVVSFIVSVVICFFMNVAGWPPVTNMLVNWSSPELIDTVAAFSVMPHFENMLRGIVVWGDVLYFVSVTGFALFLTALSLKRYSKTTMSTIAGTVVVGLAVVFGNAIFNELVKSRLDFTENKIYTLSAASKRILAKVDHPVTIKFYCSRSNTRMPVLLKNFADRVEDLLDEYKEAGGGRITLEKYDPKPLSDAEDSAIMDGVTGQMFGTFGDKVYLGVSVSCGKKQTVLPFLSPDRESMLEYDITNAISEVFRTKKMVIGVMSALPVLGGPPTQAMMQRGIYNMSPPWLFIKQLKRNTKVRKVRLDVREIDKDIDVLLLIDPAGITDDAQYAIDQFLLRGGKVAAFLDPRCFIAEAMSRADRSLLGAVASSMPTLLLAWNTGYTTSSVVGDAVFARKLRRPGTPEANYVAVLDITKKGFDPNDVTTAQLDQVNMIFAGEFPGKPPKGVKKDVLIHTTKESGTIGTFLANEPHASFRQFIATGKVRPLAVRLRGHFKTAFPDGPPWEAKKKAGKKNDKEKGKSAASDDKKDGKSTVANKDSKRKDDKDKAPSSAEATATKDKNKENSGNDSKKKSGQLMESVTDGVVVLVGDADMLYDEFCVQGQSILGQKFLVPLNDNLNFGLNTIDYLGGDSDMIGIRCRPTIQRPFEEIKRREAMAEKKFKAKIIGLENQLKHTRNRINSLQRRKKDASQKRILSPEQQEEIRKFQKEQVRVRKELKQVQKEFRKEIDALQNFLEWINILLMPALVALFGVIVAIVRRKRGGAK